jgi:hypothetical protein
MTFEPNYYVFEGNPDGQLENGSFYRDAKPPLKHGRYVQYMNGDFIDFVDELPADRIKVDRKHALKLLPEINRV